MLHDNPNVIKLEGTFFTKDGELVLAFEYMENDLSGLLSLKNLQFSPAQTKCLFKQVLEGLHQCHSAGIMHRDIKAANLLLNNGQLKLADFGLASNYARRRTFSTNVVTLWYRAPELLLGVNTYGPKVDMWSAGCLFIELLTRQSPFPGREEKHQLELIVRTCGTPDERNWPGVTKLEGYKLLQGLAGHKNRLQEVFGKFDPRALDLLSKMLALNPAQRPTASEALDHDYFWSDPLPCKAAELPHYPAMHEYEAKKTRQNERQPKRQKVANYAPNVPVAPLRAQPYPIPASAQPSRGDYLLPHYAQPPYPSKSVHYAPARQNPPLGPQWGPAAHVTHPQAGRHPAVAGDGLLPTPSVPVPATAHPTRPAAYASAYPSSGGHPPSAVPLSHYDAARSRQPSTHAAAGPTGARPSQHHGRPSASSSTLQRNGHLPTAGHPVAGTNPQPHRVSSGLHPQPHLPSAAGHHGAGHYMAGRSGEYHRAPRERSPTSAMAPASLGLGHHHRHPVDGSRHDMPPMSSYNRPPAGVHRPHPLHQHHSHPITDGHASVPYNVHRSHARATLSSVERLEVGVDTTGKRKRETAPL
jgi:cyclin-dependent kinase 12/13